MSDTSNSTVTVTSHAESKSGRTDKGTYSRSSASYAESFADNTSASKETLESTRSGNYSESSSSKGNETRVEVLYDGDFVKTTKYKRDNKDTESAKYTTVSIKNSETRRDNGSYTFASSLLDSKGKSTYGHYSKSSQKLKDHSTDGLTIDSSSSTTTDSQGNAKFTRHKSSSTKNNFDYSTVTLAKLVDHENGNITLAKSHTEYEHDQKDTRPSDRTIITHADGFKDSTGSGTYVTKHDSSTTNGTHTYSKLDSRDVSGNFSWHDFTKATLTANYSKDIKGVSSTFDVASTSTSTDDGSGKFQDKSKSLKTRFADGTTETTDSQSRKETGGDSTFAKTVDATTTVSNSKFTSTIVQKDKSDLHTVWSETDASSTTSHRNGTTSSSRFDVLHETAKLSWDESTKIDQTPTDNTDSAYSKTHDYTTSKGNVTTTTDHKWTTTSPAGGSSTKDGKSTITTSGSGKDTWDSASKTTEKTKLSSNPSYDKYSHYLYEWEQDFDKGEVTYSGKDTKTAKSSGTGPTIYGGSGWSKSQTDGKRGPEEGTTTKTSWTLSSSGTGWTSTTTYKHAEATSQTKLTKYGDTAGHSWDYKSDGVTNSTPDETKSYENEFVTYSRTVNTDNTKVTLTPGINGSKTYATSYSFVENKTSGQNEKVENEIRTVVLSYDTKRTTINKTIFDHTYKGYVNYDYSYSKDFYSLDQSRTSKYPESKYTLLDRKFKSVEINAGTDKSHGNSRSFGDAGSYDYDYKDDYKNVSNDYSKRTESSAYGSSLTTISLTTTSKASAKSSFDKTRDHGDSSYHRWGESKNGHDNSESITGTYSSISGSAVSKYSREQESWDDNRVEWDHDGYAGYGYGSDSGWKEWGGATKTSASLTDFDSAKVTGTTGSYSNDDDPSTPNYDYRLDPLSPSVISISVSATIGFLGTAWVDNLVALGGYDYVAQAEAVAADIREASTYAIDALTGTIDGFLDTINPFDHWLSVPNIGPVFGHADVYAGGYYAGIGVGVVGGFLVGHFGAGVGGLAAAARVYTSIDTLAGMAVVGDKYLSGEQLGVMDALAFAPLVGYLDCFVAGTGVWMAGAGVAPAIPVMAGENEGKHSSNILALAVGTVALSTAGFVERRRKRRLVGVTSQGGTMNTLAGKSEKSSLRTQEAARDVVFSEELTLDQELEHSACVADPDSDESKFSLTALEEALGNSTIGVADSSPRTAVHSPSEGSIRSDFPRAAQANDHLSPRLVQSESFNAIPLLRPEPRKGRGRTWASSGSSLTKQDSSWLNFSWLGALCLFACLAVAGLRGTGLAGSDARSPSLRPANLTLAASPVSSSPSQPYMKPIEDVQLGERVLADNPDPARRPNFLMEPDQATWRRIRMVMMQGEEDAVYVELLRPKLWIEDLELKPKSIVGLCLPELGAEGPAHVIEIGPCPAIQDGDGQVVTGCFTHLGKSLVNVIIDDNEPIGCSPTHLFWSETRQDFVPAGELRPLEQLRTFDNQIVTLTSITPRGLPEPIYNLEVNLEHVYYVGADGILVHNSCPVSKLLGKSLEGAGYAKPGKGWDAAHIVPTSAFSNSNRQQNVKDAISLSQEKFNKYLGAASRNGEINGFWSQGNHAGTHTDVFFLRMGELFSSVKSTKGAENAMRTLWDEIRNGNF